MKNLILKLLFISFAINSLVVCAQSQNLTFFAEGNGKEARMMWTAETWPSDIEGIVIKRKIHKGKWETLTSSPIYPLVSHKKNLSNVSTDPLVVKGLEKKIKDNKTDYFEMDSVAFMDKIRNNSGLKFISFRFAMDFDFALIAGFAFYDKKIEAKPGVFIEYQMLAIDKEGQESLPLHSWKWKFGEALQYELEATSLVKYNKTTNIVNVRWGISKDSYQQHPLLQGFYRYRVKEGKREKVSSNITLANLKENIIPVSISEEVSLNAGIVKYEVSPVTVLGYEARPLVAIFDPASVPVDFEVNLSGHYQNGEKDISFILAIPSESEKFIESVELEQREGLSKTTSVLTGLKGKKEFTLEHENKMASPKTYVYRIKCNLLGGYDPVYSQDVSIYYNPVVSPEN